MAKRILLVDDEKDVAEALQYVLEDAGYDVVTSTSVDDALEKASEGNFCAAVLDVSMGEKSGSTVAEYLRTTPATAQVPIVILSGLAESVVRTRFDRYDLFVSKAADLTRLVEQLGTLVGQGPREQARRQLL